MDTTKDLHEYLAQKRSLVEKALELYLPNVDSVPSLLHESMHYSVFAGGKRLRPIMVLMTGEMLGQETSALLFAAAAIEMIHTYSLIHDDLPAMDNDDLRRGKATNHKVYGEDIAILAGDALLTLAFEVISDPKHITFCSPGAMLSATYELGKAAGSLGMVGGQVVDMQAEKRPIEATELEYIHTHKTGKMLTAAVRIGAILSDATAQQLEAVTSYGEHVGLAFQIVDDILDIEGSPEELGKNIKSDLQKQKATYPAMYGIERSKVMVQKFINDAKISLRIFGDQAYYFYQLADFIRSRTH
jgi:geranylgeranyl diphosphate synthase type II